VPKLCMK